MRLAVANREIPVTIHFVPETFLFVENNAPPPEELEELETMIWIIYDRIRRPATRFTSLTQSLPENNLRRWFKAPAFTLPRASISSGPFVFEHISTELDLVDRHTFLHVGYKISQCGKWAFVASIDQHGETHDFDEWMLPEEQDDEALAAHIWKCALDIATQANVEWRITIAKLGQLNEE